MNAKDMEIIAAFVERVAEAVVLRTLRSTDLPRGEKGADGTPGPQGDKGDKGDTGETIQGPVGPQGEQGIQGLSGPGGTVGPTGPPGIQGEKGAPGVNGADSVVAGPQGKRGERGEPGIGRDGRDGKDGIASRDEMKALIAEAVGEAVPLAVKDWGSAWAGEQPDLRYMDIWVPDHKYKRGNLATWGGSLWHANVDNMDKPGTSESWTLVAKRGRDGKDGKDAVKA